jgi:hypothetical protein
MKLDPKNFKVSAHMWTKRPFNPNDAVDLAEYAYFLQNSSWKNGCPFVLEWPYSNIIKMVEDKFVKRHIMSAIKTAKQR